MNATPQPISSRRNRLFCGAPDTFFARSRPDSEVMSVKVTRAGPDTVPAGGSARRVCATADAGARSALCARLERNSLREKGAGGKTVTGTLFPFFAMRGWDFKACIMGEKRGKGCLSPFFLRAHGHGLRIPVHLAAFLIQLVRLAIEPGERLHRRAAL